MPGLAEDVLDHRLNSRTVYMNPVLRFLYWNMNYHVEHHMFPMVPYHALPELHEAIKADMPEPYPSFMDGLPGDHPGPAGGSARSRPTTSCHELPSRQIAMRDSRRREAQPPERERSRDSQWAHGSKRVRPDDIDEEDVIRFDHGGPTFAIYRIAG